MNILSLLEDNEILNRLQGISDNAVKNAFFANYLGALILLRLKDIHGSMLINDPIHADLSKFHSNMSDINFWGKALFHSNEIEIRNRMGGGHGDFLNQMVTPIDAERKKAIMHFPLCNPDSLNWDEVIGSVICLSNCVQLNSSYFNGIVRILYNWNSLKDINKRKAISSCYMYLLQSDPNSKLLSRFRELANFKISFTESPMKVINFRKIVEDEGGGTSTGNIASDGGGSGNMIINPAGFDNSSSSQPTTTDNDFANQLGGLYKLAKLAPKQVTKKGRFTIRDGKIVKKKVQGFKARKFKAPEYYLKAASKGDE